MKLRPATSADSEAVLALNEESVEYLSPLDDRKLSSLVEQAALYLVVEDQGVVIAFLLALREGAQYDSPNYTWFANRYAQFLYVDRVVVSKAIIGKGLGSMLYTELFSFASNNGISTVTCEFDVEPPNADSERFHARFGFKEVGRQVVADGRKVVSLQTADALNHSIGHVS